MTGAPTAAIVESKLKCGRGVEIMLRTIQVSSCISVQGEIVEVMTDGTVLIRDGNTLYRGRPIELRPEAPAVVPRVRARAEPKAAVTA